MRVRNVCKLDKALSASGSHYRKNSKVIMGHYLDLADDQTDQQHIALLDKSQDPDSQDIACQEATIYIKLNLQLVGVVGSAKRYLMSPETHQLIMDSLNMNLIDEELDELDDDDNM